jgi:glutamate-ammonia-ligase adenylyltransferase
LRDAPFAVLSLGKLGGNELNYSSDVDLMFLFAEGAAVSSALPEREYFIRLAQRIAELLSQPTREGAIFRIDLRLRPQGTEGETAISLAHALRYYEERADDWELQALIKARHSAGDINIAREFIHGVEHRVYRSGLNFSAIETALVSQRRISARRRQQKAARRGDAWIDVKVDRGGIRDIEFLVQCLQRVYGGEELWLRSGGTLFSLQKLHDKSHISGKDFHELTQAYEFLRRVEHRLQLRRGQQTHRPPRSPEQLEVLARSLGARAGGTPIGDARALVAQLKQHMDSVSAIYERVVHAQHSIQQRAEAAPALTLQPSRAAEAFREDSYSQLLHRLSVDSPVLWQLASRRDLSTHTRRNLQRFLNSALTSSERYAAIVRHAPSLEKALALFENSDYLSEILIRYPDEISTIADIGETMRPAGNAVLLLDSPASAAQPDATLSFAVSGVESYNEKLSLIRRHYRRQTFAFNVSDLLHPRPVFDSLASATSAADAAIAAALEIARSQGGDGSKPANLAVLALGRLGTNEFDLGSDADLLFVRDSGDDPLAAKRLAEQVVNILAAYTQEGTVFAVDARLRPLGGEGELVNTPAMLQSYFSSGGEAQAWEALTFTKLRHLAGDKNLGEEVSSQIINSLRRFAESEHFLAQVLEMRQRLVQTGSGSEVNFKTSAGGFYDIDFIVAYLFVKHRLALPGANTRERLRHLATHNVLDDADCATLDYAAELLRAVDHAVRLVSGRSRSTLPAAEHLRRCVEQLSARILDTEFAGSLSSELERTLGSVRGLYERLMR